MLMPCLPLRSYCLGVEGCWPLVPAWGSVGLLCLKVSFCPVFFLGWETSWLLLDAAIKPQGITTLSPPHTTVLTTGWWTPQLPHLMDETVLRSISTSLVSHTLSSVCCASLINCVDLNLWLRTYLWEEAHLGMWVQKPSWNFKIVFPNWIYILFYCISSCTARDFSSPSFFFFF